MGQMKIAPEALPFNFDGYEEQYGKIDFGELIGPGIYYVVTDQVYLDCGFGEYLVVKEGRLTLSQEARACCTPLPTMPSVLLCKMDYLCTTNWIVLYEVYSYLEQLGLPLPRGESVREVRMRGMEFCPEYFGEFPIPTETPWGPAIGHDRLWSGLDWLKTQQAGWVLAVAWPLCDDLSTAVEKFGVLMEEDRKSQERDHIFNCIFFPYEQSCLVVLELLRWAKDTWAPKINMAALNNAVRDLLVCEEAALGKELTNYFKEQLPPLTADAGTDFYPLP